LYIKALLSSNSGILQMKATPRVRKIALLGKFAYPELRLFNNFGLCICIEYQNASKQHFDTPTRSLRLT
ncbi:hypothetical protein CWB97_22035, partial [Pseudoalteromonas citrea]